MSTLLFVFEVIGFCVVAHWAYVNDRAGAKGGGEGLLRMVEPAAPQANARRAAGPRWRRSSPADGKPAGRMKAQPKAGQAHPRWKQPFA